MANEITLDVPAMSGNTLYALLLNSAGQVRDVVAGAWDSPTDADWGDYDTALTEQGTATGVFVGSMPSGISAGVYTLSVRQQAGGSPAVGDDQVWVVDALWWDGDSILLPGDVLTIEGSDATTQLGDAVWDEAVEDTETARQLLRLLRAFVAGKTSGGGTSTVTFKSRDGATTRISMTVDTDGDRSAVTTDVT